MDYEEAVESKKQLLNLEIDFLHLLRRISAYKLLRKKDLAESNKMKSGISDVKLKLNNILISFPKEELEKIKEKEREKEKFFKEKSTVIKKIRKDKIEKELDEIKEKLARLG